jgi:hypothetical protein
VRDALARKLMGIALHAAMTAKYMDERSGGAAHHDRGHVKALAAAKKDGAPPDAGREFNEVLGKAFRMVQQIAVLADAAGEVGAKALQAELGQAWRAILKAHGLERRSKAGGMTYDAAGRAMALQEDGRITGGDEQRKGDER